MGSSLLQALATVPSRRRTSTSYNEPPSGSHALVGGLIRYVCCIKIDIFPSAWLWVHNRTHSISQACRSRNCRSRCTHQKRQHARARPSFQHQDRVEPFAHLVTHHRIWRARLGGALWSVGTTSPPGVVRRKDLEVVGRDQLLTARGSLQCR